MRNNIVIDIEWDPGTGSKIQAPTVLQIGAVKLENDQIIDSYFSFIKPQDTTLNMDRLDFMPVKESQIMNGKDKNTVLNEFSRWCSDEPYFILFGSYNYLVFQSFVRDHIEISLNNAVDIQLPLSLHFGEEMLSLEKICRAIGLEIPGPLHHSLGDAKLLAELYKHIQTQDNLQDLIFQYYSDREERRGEKRREKRRRKRAKIRCQSLAMQKVPAAKYPYKYFMICESGELHKKSCSALRDVSIVDTQGFQTLKNALKNSKKTCPLCFYGIVNIHPALTSRQLILLIGLNSLCSELNLTCENHERTFIVKTPAGSWYFEIDTRHPILYHRNYVYDERNLQGALSGYHRQPVSLNSDREAVRYISKHDRMILRGSRKDKTKYFNPIIPGSND